jgi:glycogen(starch) synthase
MNVAIFASAFYPSLGGVEELCRQLAHEYQRQGMAVIVVTNRWPRDMAAYEVYEGIPVYRIPMRVPEGSIKAKANYQLTNRRIKRELVKILREERIDVLHIQCVSSSVPYARHAQERLGLPLVVTLQGELTMDATGLYQRSALARRYMRDALEHASAITACSRQTLEEAEAFYGAPFGERGSVIYNGVSLDDFRDAPPYSHPRPYVLAMGRHVPQKGFDVLLRAFAAAVGDGDFEQDLILAGNGSEHEALKALAVSLGVAGRVRFPGRADRGQAASLFKGCSFFILPSRHEPFGIVNLEAMASGKAVIASRVGGVPEFVTEGETGLLVAAEDVGALAGAIRQLAGDGALRTRLGIVGSERASGFSWSMIAKQYFALYSNIVSQPSSKLHSPLMCEGK